MSRIDAALRDLYSLDTVALRSTVLSGLDPRAKIIVTLAFILVVVSFDRYRVAALIPFALFPVVLSSLGSVPPRLILRKVLIAAPFALMVGIFNPWIDQSVVLTMGHVAVSAGWLSFFSIMLRFLLTVTAAVILVGSTGFHRLCVGLRHLGLPGVFINQLLFLYRYVYLLTGEAARMNAARELRAIGRRGMPLAVYGALLGHLLLRSLERAQRIHQAMAARVFTGELHSLRPLRWQRRDTVFVVFCLTLFGLGRCYDFAGWLGRLLMGVFS